MRGSGLCIISKVNTYVICVRVNFLSCLIKKHVQYKLQSIFNSLEDKLEISDKQVRLVTIADVRKDLGDSSEQRMLNHFKNLYKIQQNNVDTTKRKNSVKFTKNLSFLFIATFFKINYNILLKILKVLSGFIDNKIRLVLNNQN